MTFNYIEYAQHKYAHEQLLAILQKQVKIAIDDECEIAERPSTSKERRDQANWFIKVAWELEGKLTNCLQKWIANPEYEREAANYEKRDEREIDFYLESPTKKTLYLKNELYRFACHLASLAKETSENNLIHTHFVFESLRRARIDKYGFIELI